MSAITIEYSHPRPSTAERRKPPKASIENLIQSIKGMVSVSEALRIFGAGVVIASMSLFLLQGWNEGNDINRYLLLLAQTALLTTGGIALSHGLKETKGARVFFGLSLISIPVNFTILSALVYSVFQLDGALTTYPGYATWQIDSIASIALTLTGACFVLVPTALFCFAIMARHSAKQLALHFLPLNLLLLIPVRESMLAGGIAMASIVYGLWVARKLGAKDKALQTPEGRFALATLFIPTGILLFRSMYFYSVDSLMIAMLGTAAFVALRQAALYPDRSPLVANSLDILSLPVALITAGALIDSTTGIGIALAAPATALLFSIMAGDVLRRSASQVVSRTAAGSINLALATGFMASVAIDASVITAIASALIGLAMVLCGRWFTHRPSIFAGSATLIAAAIFGFEPFVMLVVEANWMSLAAIGASAIALGSLIERHGVTAKLKLVDWSERLTVSREGVVIEE